MSPVYINGKFCAQRTTGVQRYAHNVVAALDEHLAATAPRGPWTLLLPPGTPAPALRALAVRHLPWLGPPSLHAWEQLVLPRAARRGLLLNLAGSSPVPRVGTQLCVLHDAALFDRPEIHTLAFRVWYCALFRRLARHPGTTLATVSAFSRERLAAALALPLDRVAVVPGGAEHLDRVPPDPTALAARGLDRQPFVLAVGSRNPSKNLPRLVEAWCQLNRANWRLAIVGGANRHVFGRGGTPPLAPGVIELGAVDDATLKALYEQAQALVFPSLYEGFGLPPLEAMAHGCPVVASTAPALREVCGDAALYVDPLSSSDIAQGIARLIDDAALQARLRERGLGRAAHFTWNSSARALLELVGRITQ